MATGRPLGNMVIELGLDSAAFSKNLKGASQAVRNATSEMRNNFKIIDAGGNKLDAYKSKQSGLTKVIEAQQKEVDELTKAYEESYDAQGNATAKTADLARKTNYAKGRLAGYESQLEQVNIKIREMESVTIKAGKNMQTFGKKLTSFGKGMSSIGKKMTMAITAPLVAFGVGLAKNGIQVQKFREQAGVYYTNLYQDANKAKKKLDDLMTYAKTTPYAYESIVEIDKTLQTFGVTGEKTQTVLETITETIAGIGGSQEDLKEVATVFGQISSSGRLNTQDMMQLVNRGIPAFNVVANGMGITVAELREQMSKGAVDSETAISLLTKGLMEGTDGINGATAGYEGSLAAVKNTLPGAVDSFKSARKNLALELINTDVYDTMIKAIRSLTDMINSGALLPVIKLVSDALAGMLNRVIDITKWFTNLSPETQQFAVKMVGLAAALGPVLWIGGNITSMLGGMFSKVGTGLVAFGKLIAKTGTLSGALKGFGAVIAGPAGIAALIGVLIAGIVAAYIKFDWFREKVNEVFSFIYNNVIKPIMSAVTSFFQQQLSMITQFWNQNSTQIMQAVSRFTNFIQPVIKVAMLAIEFIIKTVWGNIKGIITGALNIIMGAVKVFTAIFTGDWKMLWNGIKQIVSGAIQVVWNWINLMFIGRILKGIGGLAAGSKNLISGMWQGIKNFFSGGINGAVSSTSGFVGKIKGFFSGMKTSLISTVKSMWSNIASNFTTYISNVVTKVKNMPGQMADGIRKGGGALKDAFAAIWKTAAKGVAAPANKIIEGANWILGKFGSENKIAKWVPYAKGTDGHKGGHALVNDQKGPNYREAVQLPNGNTFIPEGRNVLLPDLPKGSKVLPAAQTKALYRYKNGIGDWASGIWNGVKKGAKKVKDTALDVFEYIANPSKLVDKVISNFVDYDGLGGIALSMGKGLVGKVTGSMKSWVANFIEKEVGDPGGGGGGPINFGGLVRTSKFGWRTHPITGKRKLHGGVDFGGGQGIGHPIKAQVGGKVVHAGRAGTFGNMVKLHQGIYDYIYAHLSKILVKNGQSVAAGKLIGLMGSTGASTGPHVHYEIRKNGKRIDPETASVGKKGTATGGNVERWRGTVVKALSMNGLPTTPAYVNAWLRQIKTESGGNPRAVQGNIGDINNRTGDLAKGLVQVIGSTFRAYSFKGHKNRFNPLDSLLAGMNYAKSRYGVAGMLRKIGHGHGYANGGLVRNHQIAEIAEGNKPEMVIPLTKKARAVQLIQKAQDILGMNEEYQVSQQNNQNVELYRLMNDQNKLLRALLEKESNIYMDSEKVGRATAPAIDRINGRNIVFAEGRVLK